MRVKDLVSRVTLGGGAGWQENEGCIFEALPGQDAALQLFCGFSDSSVETPCELSIVGEPHLVGDVDVHVYYITRIYELLRGCCLGRISGE
jgi:hypothetical protein